MGFNLPTIKKLLCIFLLNGCLFLFAHPLAFASTINQSFTYQGKLFGKTTGSVITSSEAPCIVSGSGNDTCDFRVSLYSTLSGGTLLWQETKSNVEIGADGSFELVLDCGGTFSSCNQNGGPDFTSGSIYTELEFSSNGDSTFNEIFSPRKKLTAVPYAFNADTVDGISITKVTNNPEGSLSGSVGDLALNTSDGKIYMKTSGSGATGWNAASGGTTYTAGNGVDLTGSAISLTLDGGTLANSSAGLKVASGGITTTEIANGTIQGTDLAADAVTLGTKTNGNYVASITNGLGISGGDGGTEGSSLTLSLDIDGLSAVTTPGDSDTIPIYSGGTVKKVAKSNLLSAITGALTYQGSFNGNAASLPTCDSGAKGKYYVANANGDTYSSADWAVCSGSDWQKISNTTGVTAFNSRQGTVTPQSGDYTATQITNTPAGGISATTVQGAINALDTGKLGMSLNSGSILVGNDSNVAAPVSLSGDITMTNAGVTSIGSGKVTNAMLSGSIDWSKIFKTGAKLSDLDVPSYSGNSGKVLSTDGTNLAWADGLTTTLASGMVFLGNGSNVATAVTPTGDVLIDNTGTTSIGSGKVTNTMLAGSIADGKLNTITTANKVSGSAVQLGTNGGLEDSTGLKLKLDGTTLALGANGVKINTITNAELTDNTITFAKLAANSCANGQVVKFDGTNWTCGADNVGSVSSGNLTTATSGITITGGTGAILGSGTTIEIASANGTTTGLLTGADWTTFNSKEGAITAGTTPQYYRGDKSWQTLDKTAVGITKLSDIDAPSYTGNAGKVLSVNGTADGLIWASSLTDALTSGSIFVGNASNMASAVAMSGDVTINNTGITSIGSGKVTNAMLAGSIADSKLNTITTSGKVSGSAVQLGANGGLEDSTGLKMKLDGTTLSLGSGGLKVNFANANTWTADQTIGNGNALAFGDNTSELRFKNSLGTNYVGFKSPSAISSNNIWVLPNADGSDGQVLVTDGSGNLSWSTISANPTTITLTDNLGTAYTVKEGTNNYVLVNTADGSENVSFGNATTNPTFSFLGTGTVTVNGDMSVVGGVSLNSNLSMNSKKITGLASPIDNTDAANKSYVDAMAMSISWQAPVTNLASGAAPGTPATGDRYILQTGFSGFGSCTINQVAQWSGSVWNCSSPTTGWTAYAATPAQSYNYNGTNWVSLGSTVNHSSLSNLQGGQSSEYYHLKLADYNDLTNANAQLTALQTTGSPTFAGLTVSGSGTFTSGTGAVTLNGNTTLSGATTFTTGTGAVSLNGDTTIAAGKKLILGNNTSEINLKGSGATYVGLKAPGTIASNVIWTLPNADGTSGQVLKTDGSGELSWTSASAPPISGLLAATATNSIDNTNYAQTWNWSTATTQNPLTITANTLTSGSGLSLTTSSTSINSSNGLLYVANTGSSTNGVVGRIQSNATIGSGLTVLASGKVGVGTTSPLATVNSLSTTEQLRLSYDASKYTSFTVDSAGLLTIGGTSGNVSSTGYAQFNSGLLSSGTTTGYTVPSGSGTRLMWIPSKRAFRAGAVSGTKWDNANIGDYSTAFGNNTQAQGTSTMAVGDGSSALGNYSFAGGYNSSTGLNANSAFAYGYGAQANGGYSVAFGDTTKASDNAVAMGYGANASGLASVALGYYTIASGAYSFSAGFSGQALGDGSIAVGYNESGDNTSFSSGGKGSVVLGYASSGNTHKTTGIGAVAIGQDVNATGDNTLVFGKGLTVSTPSTFNVGFGSGITIPDFKVTSGAVVINGILQTTGAITAPTSGNTINGLVINTGTLSTTSNGNLTLAPNGTGTIQFSSSLIPTTNGTLDIGDATHLVRDLYISNNSLKIGGSSLSNSSGTLTWAGGAIQATGGNSSLSTAAITTLTTTTATIASLTTSGTTSLNGDTLVAAGKAITFADNTSELRFNNAAGTNYVGFKASTTISANKVWTLPGVDGSNGQVLKTDGSGTLSWVTAGGTDVSLADNTANAYRIHNGSNDFINVNTTTGSNALNLWNTSVASNIVINTSAVSGGAAGIIAPNVAAELYSTGRTDYNVVAANSNNSANASIRGADGMPLFAYKTASNYINIIHCDTANCSSFTTTGTNITNGETVQLLSMVMTSDNKPVIFYWTAGTPYYIKSVKCGNSTCSSGNSAPQQLAGGASVTSASGIAASIDSDTFPIVMTGHRTSTSYLLSMLHCANQNCSSAGFTTVDGTGDSSYGVGVITAPAIGSEGYPIAAYVSGTTGTGYYTRTVKCGNVACTSSSYYTIFNSYINPYGIVVPNDTYPVIMMSNGVYKCSNIYCSGGTTTTLTYGYAQGGSGLLDPATGNPIFAGYGGAGYNYNVILCGNKNCSSGNTETIVATSVGNASNGQIFFGSNGYPSMGYYQAGTTNLNLIRCVNAACTSGAAATYTGYGVDLGTSSKFFRNAYAATFYGKSTTVASFDLAEEYPTKDTSLSAGELVGLDPQYGGFVKRADTSNLVKLVGVVSTDPGLLLGSNGTEFGTDEYAGETKIKLALAGRVPTKVNNEGGAIAIGDPITLSTTPGVGRKALSGEPIVGYALESLSGSTGTIKLFLNLSSQTQEGTGLDSGLAFSLAQSIADQKEILSSAVSMIDALDLRTKNIVASEDGKTVFKGILIADTVQANHLIGGDLVTGAELSTLDNELVKNGKTLKDITADLTDVKVKLASASSFLTVHTLETTGAVTFKSGTTFMGSSVFKAIVEFMDRVIFHKNVSFLGTATFNSDTAGYAVVNAGETSVEVLFEKPYQTTPVITTSLRTGVKLDWYGVASESAKGFTIKLAPKQDKDVEFSWTAVSVKDAKTTKASPTPSPTHPPVAATEKQETPTSTNSITPSITPTETLTPSPTPTLVPSITPEATSSGAQQ